MDYDDFREERLAKAEAADARSKDESSPNQRKVKRTKSKFRNPIRRASMDDGDFKKYNDYAV